MLRIWICTVFAAFWITALTATTQSADLQRLSDDIVPKAYDLAFTIDPRQKRFSGETSIVVTLAKPTTELTINGRDLRVSKATLTPKGGAAIAATFREDPNNPGWARVTLSGAAPAGEALLTIRYDAPFAEQLGGMYVKISEDGTAYAFTQMEPLFARRVFPSFDEPRFKTPFTVKVTAQKSDVVVTNGPLRRSEPRGGQVAHLFATTEPLPTYLIALAVGPFDVVEAKPMPKTALRRREIPLRGIALKGKGADFAMALARTPAFIEWFEAYFATPYPYAKLDLIAAPDMPGAMENAGAIVYGERYILLNSQSSTADVRNFAELHAHELAHQWLGDLVTPAWWDDIWLNEGFATWMSYRSIGDVMPETGLGVALRSVTNQGLARDMLRDVKSVRRPLRTEEDIERAFDFATYYKGAAIIAMVEDYVGRDRFRDGLRLHVARFPHGHATSKDLFASLEKGTGDSQIAAIFSSFIDQSRAPIVTGALSCKAAPRQAVTQNTYTPLGQSFPQQRWTIPLCARPVTGQRACTVIAEQDGAVQLADKACPSFVSMNAGAGYFHQAYDADGWKALAANTDRLTSDEQVTALDGARAAFASNAIQPAALLDIVDKGAASTDARVAVNAVEQVQALEIMAPQEALPAYRSWVRTTLAEPFARTAKQRSPTGLSVALLRALAINGRDPVVRARLLESGRSMMGGFQLLRSSTPQDLALRVAVEDGGPEVFATLLAAAKMSEDILFRWDALRALGRAPRAEDRAAFATAFKGFKGVEALLALMELAGDRTTAAFAWDIAKTQIDDLIARDPTFTQHVALFARGLCSAEGRADLQSFMTANAAKLKNHEATTSRTIDGIDHCIALRTVQGPPLAQALRSREKKVAARRMGDRKDNAVTLAFEQLSATPAEPEATFGEVVKTCGQKFPRSSPLAMCAGTDAPAACRDIRLMVGQCMRR